MTTSLIKNKWKMPAPGSVRAKGFLLEQLLKQKDNFTGLMEEYPDYSGESGWLGGTGESWERGPYYVRGLVSLAYTLRDFDLIEKSRKWIDYTLTHQDEEGNFYPFLTEETAERKEAIRKDWWPHMPMLMAVRDYYEGESFLGYNDKRILPFFDKYFVYQLKNLQSNPLKDWGKARGGDNIELVLWYYNIVKEDWLLELALLLESQTYDWIWEFEHTKVQQHVVNTVQAYKTPYLKYKLHGDKRYLDALHKGLDTIRKDHGRIDDLPNADEAARDNLFTRGTESCAVAEGMLSMEICGMITGETVLYDYLETYAYNSLPNCFTYDLARICYFQMQNEISASCGYHGFECDHGDSSAYGAPAGFDCCFANTHMAYPKFVQNMWMESEDGLAVTCYGPNELMAVVNEKKVRILQQTGYPYSDTVNFMYSGEKNKFCLSFRKPGWSASVRIQINGAEAVTVEENGYLKIYHVFEDGDYISLEFMPEIQIINWHHNSMAVRRGALLYALPIKEKEEILEDVVAYREIKFEPYEYKKTLEIYPESKWNYALYPQNMEFISEAHRVEECSLQIPCGIRLEAMEDPEWKADNNVAGHFGYQRYYYEKSKMEEKELVPYSHTRLKISVFPKVYSPEKLQTECTELDVEVRRFLNCIQVNFAILPEAEEYILECRNKKDGITLYAVPVNLYNGGVHTFIKKERFTFDSGREAEKLCMYALKDRKAIGKSKLITV